MVRIEPLGDDATQETLAAIDRIFFASSRRQVFADDAERGAFREQWLGRYLLHDRQHAFIARAEAGAVAGYLIGSLDDPAVAPRFADIGFYARVADLTARFPAHLHINLDAAWRSQGVGARLVERFACHATKSGVSGVHIVTGAEARNVRFYDRCGFEPMRELDWMGSRILFMGRSLSV